MALTTALSMLHYVAGSEDKNFVDRLHATFTTNILIGLSVLVSFKQFGGKPLECLVPDLFSGAWEQVMNALSNVIFAGRFINDDAALVDIVDALSLLTTNMLIAIALIQSYKQFSGRAIECLTPDVMPFTGSEEYAEQYCFASDTYYIPMKDTIADVHTEARRERRISYYQWVPFFLLISAACFRLPSLLWKHFADYSGIRIQQIIKLASDANNIKPDIKAANIRSLCVHLQGALRFHRRLQRRNIRPHRFFRIFNLQYSAYYVCIMYLFTKFLFLLNVGLQLYLMNSFLGTDKYRFYGFGAVRDLINGTSWEQSGVFPRVSLCDFTVRVMGNIQDYTIQCVLVINIFNEKIFIFLYLWYLFLLVFTFGSFVYWWIVAFCPCYNIGYIARHLEMSEDPVAVEEKEVRRNIKQFVENYLKADGMFAIRMLSTYSGVIFGTDLVKALWASFHGIEIARKSRSETDLRNIGIDKNHGGPERHYQRYAFQKSKDFGEERRLVPPNISPPSDLMRALMEKGTETTLSSPAKSVTSSLPPVNFTVGDESTSPTPVMRGGSPINRFENNFYHEGDKVPPYPGSPTSKRGTLDRHPPPHREGSGGGGGRYSPPPSQLSQRKVHNSTMSEDVL